MKFIRKNGRIIPLRESTQQRGLKIQNRAALVGLGAAATAGVAAYNLHNKTALAAFGTFLGASAADIYGGTLRYKGKKK